MSTPRTPIEPDIPAGSMGQTSGPAVSGKGAAGPDTPQPPRVWPRCECGHPRGVHDIAKKDGARTKCLTGLPPKGLPCECVAYEPEVTR